MHRLANLVLVTVTLFLAPAPFGNAQNAPAEITVVSVLTMAKDAAEGGSREHRREILRAEVAEAIKRLGLKAAYENFIEEALTPLWRRTGRWDDDPSRREAKQLFLSGNPDGAKQLIGRAQCLKRKCWFFNELAFNSFFLHWEMEAGNLLAARQRLRANNWAESEPIMAVQVARAFIVAGRQTEIPDILTEINDRFQDAAKGGLLADGAALRKVASEGNAPDAIKMTQGEQDTKKRVRGFIIISEALAGIPGLPDERLIREWER